MTHDAVAALDRAALAVLVREHLLAGHLIDRAGMPHVLGAGGVAAMQAVAIDEWAAASPVYARRMQRLLGFDGQDDVAAIFKGMQLDIGAPPEFMDFRYEVTDAGHGAFHLAHCGALMDVEPMGDELVVAMCHHIEDPTFDATAAATNPRARVRPIHRPPRLPADRHPHCAWTVTIDPAADALVTPAVAERLARSEAARLALPVVDRGPEAPGGGRDDYVGPLDPDLRMEHFSTAALRAIDDEVCLQGHLLALAFAAAVAGRLGRDAAADVARHQLTGIAGVAADRLHRALQALRPTHSGAASSGSDGPAGSDDPGAGERASDAGGIPAELDAIAAVVELHPLLRPRTYVDARLARTDDTLTLSLLPCPALDEAHAGFQSWPMLLATGDPRPLEALVQAVDPRARVEAVREHDGTGGAPDGAVAAWRISVDPTAAPAPELDDVTLTRFSTGADFRFGAGQARDLPSVPVVLG